MTTMMAVSSSSEILAKQANTSDADADDADEYSHGLKSITSTLAKMNSVVSTSLHRSMRQRNIRNDNDSNNYDDDDDGKKQKRGGGGGEAPLVDYLTVKNSLMISYLIDLILLLRSRLSSSSVQKNIHDADCSVQKNQRECLDRLQEMKIALEKMRPLEKKMRYQIDKLLALSTVLTENSTGGGGGGGSAGMFASVGREVDDEDVRKEKNGRNDGASEPLSYKPDLRGMMKNMFVAEDDEQNNVDFEGHRRGDDIDTKSNRAKIFLDKEDTFPSSSSNVYQPPRLQSVPFELDNNDRIARKHERNLEKKRERQSRSELTQVIKSQFTDAPEEEDARGGASLGLQSDRSRKISSRNAELEAFEEGHMMRLSAGRKEKKERKRMMREEMSNLGAIADGLGNVVAGVDDAFGGGGGGRIRTTPTGDGGAGRGGSQESYKTKGMRRRKVDVIDHEGVARKKKKSAKNGGATNTYQKSLYGGGGRGGERGGGGDKGGGRGRGRSRK